MKHTEGPWRINPEVWGDQGEYLEPQIVADTDIGPIAIATVRVGLVESGGNANLLAAAPELLIHCKAMMTAWQKFASKTVTSEESQRMADKLQKLIVKAECPNE